MGKYDVELNTDDFDDYEDYLEAYDNLKEEKRLEFLADTREKVYKCNDGDFAYRCLVLMTCIRYKLPTDYPPEVVYLIVNDYVKKIADISFEEYINGEDAPLVREYDEIPKLFPEFSMLSSKREIIDLANKVYDLNLEIVSEGMYSAKYLYSPCFSFESFTPINIDEVRSLKKKLEVLLEFDSTNPSVDELKAKIADYGLDDEILDMI